MDRLGFTPDRVRAVVLEVLAASRDRDRPR
jgi:hypothetical protein